MGKTAKSPTGKNDDSSPAKGGGGTNKQKLAIKNSPTKKEGGERVSIYVDIRYLRPHFYSYPLMPS